MNKIQAFNFDYKLNYRNKNIDNTKPAFRGVMGKELLKKISEKKTPSIRNIVDSTANLIGLSYKKVYDIVESLVYKIEDLNFENSILKNDFINLLAKTRESEELLEKEKKQLIKEYDTIIKYKNKLIEEKENEIKIKDNELSILNKYKFLEEGLSEENLTVLKIMDLIKKIKENDESAKKSLENYLLNGTGEDAFVEQIDKIVDLQRTNRWPFHVRPEIKATFKETMLGKQVNLSAHEHMAAIYYLRRVLRESEEITNILKNEDWNSKQIEIILENAEKLIDRYERDRHETNSWCEIRGRYKYYSDMKFIESRRI